MKKAICLITALALTVSLMVMGVSAANFENLADELSGLDLFRGTEQGYELDRAPTRVEAGVMLVRLLGKEEQAKADYANGTITHPFTDVLDWEAPYVAYLYQNGLTNGTGGTTYSPEEVCDAQMFCTFALRTLGYSDKEGGDFTYQEALSYAKQVGIADDLLLSGDFSRGRLAAVSYNALGTPLKGGETLLLQALVESGAVEEAAAAPILEKLDNYKKYEQAAAAWGDINAFDMTANVNMTMKDGSGEEIAVVVPMDIKAIVDGDDIQMEMKLRAEVLDEEPVEILLWVKDGCMYMQLGDEKLKLDLDLNEQLTASQNQVGAFDKMAPYLIGNVTIEQKGDDTVYTFADDGMFSQIFDMAIAGMKEQMAGVEIQAHDFNYTITVDKDGMLKEMAISYSMNAAVAGETMDMSLTMVCTVNALGDSVTITFPDFTDFVEMPAVTYEEAPVA